MSAQYRSSWRCHYCGCELSLESRAPNQKTIDHKIPKSRGGTNHPSNIVSACRRCNEEKADRTDVEFRAGRKRGARGKWRPAE